MMGSTGRQFSVPEWLLPTAMGCALLGVYLATMAPGLTWANGGADGGDLITAAATGGVAHPTGYPVYLLLAAGFQSLRIGTLAYRTNLLSALSMSGAAYLVFAVVRRALQALQVWPRMVGALIAALAFGLSPLAWSQAVITEVHAVHVLFMAALVYLVASWTSPTPVQAMTIGLIVGLAIGNHALSVLMVPAVLLVVSWPCAGPADRALRTWKDRSWDWRSFGPAVGGVLLGLLTYLILPIRAAAHPALNWGDPVTLDRFFWLVSGQLYHDYFMPFNGAVAAQHVSALASLTLAQFGLAGLVLAVLGVTVFFTPSPLYLLTIWAALSFLVFALQYDVADWSVYLLPVFLAASIWLGVALGQLIELAARSLLWAPALIALVCVGYLGLRTSANWPEVDASHDLAAENYGRQVMTAAPARAILFAQGDQAVFTLWYFQHALQERPDLVVIANDLLTFDWYRENLQYTYPDLVLPAPSNAPWLATVREANPGRAACYPYFEDVVLNCQ